MTSTSRVKLITTFSQFDSALADSNTIVMRLALLAPCLPPLHKYRYASPHTLCSVPAPSLSPSLSPSRCHLSMLADPNGRQFLESQVVVLYTAPGCPHCNRFLPALNSMSVERSVDKNPKLDAIPSHLPPSLEHTALEPSSPTPRHLIRHLSHPCTADAPPHHQNSSPPLPSFPPPSLLLLLLSNKPNSHKPKTKPFPCCNSGMSSVSFYNVNLMSGDGLGIARRNNVSGVPHTAFYSRSRKLGDMRGDSADEFRKLLVKYKVGGTELSSPCLHLFLPPSCLPIPSCLLP